MCENKGMSQPYVTTPERPYPQFVRARKNKTVAGVASGLSTHLNMDVLVIRLVLVGLSILGGFGLILYALLWVFTPQGEPAEPKQRYRVPTVFNVLLVLVAVVASGAIALDAESWSLVIAVPMIVVIAGALMAWQAYDRMHHGGASTAVVVAIITGAVLVIGGITVAILMWDTGGMGSSLVAVLLTLTGVVVLVGPVFTKLWEQVNTTHAEKAVAEHRAEVASHLHDSVLQTLTLIQKRAQDPEEVTRLARAQERQLRSWLFDPKDSETTTFEALERAAGEVEDMYGIHIAPVTVGEDRPLKEAENALVMAAREAMVNAAKHAQVDRVDVYAEHLGGTLSIFIRDRGVGFDPEAIPADRHGIKESIYERVEKLNGTVTISSAPKHGTEVILELP